MHLYKTFEKRTKDSSITYTDPQTVRIVNRRRQIKDDYNASNK